MAKMKYGLSTFIGESITGLPSPIFFDPHYPILINKPPVTLITGSPGSGKTFSGEVMCAQSSVMNKTTFVIDPKGDFIALKKLEQAKEINKTTVWSIFSNETTPDGEVEVNEENFGMLDPLTLTDNRDDNVALTADVIISLVKHVTHKQQNSLLPIIRDAAESNNPSMQKVIHMLQSNPDDEVRALGLELDVPCRMSIAKLIVSDQVTKSTFTFDKGLMIISLLGLELPSSETPESDYSYKERLSTVVMRLITQLVLEAMKKLPKRIQKTLFIDEAWVVFGSKSGRSLINQAALLGRSLNMATILATQSPRHIAENDGSGSSTLDTTISTRFAFRNDSERDNEINRKAMKLPENDGWEDIFPQFEPGQCMMRDCRGNLAIIHIITSDLWTEMFDTNPSADLKKLKE